MAYCTEDIVSLWVSLTGKSTTVKNVLMEAATEYVDNATGDKFVKEDGAAKLFDGMGSEVLKVWPKLRSITKLEVMDDAGDWEEVSSDEYRIADNWIERTDGTFPNGIDNVRVTGNWGWTSTPNIIKLVTGRIAAVMLEQKGQITSETIGAYSVTTGKDGAITVEQVLNMYRLHAPVDMGTIPFRREIELADETIDDFYRDILRGL
ncbi:MAG: hypothetical protein AB1401_00480 [Thermodesulfobacteriota bacterium]